MILPGVVLLSYQKAGELNDEHVESTAVEDARVSGDLAVVRGIDMGTTTPRSGGEPVKFNVKWLIVFERQSTSKNARNGAIGLTDIFI
jgi:hypothetical protein